MAATRHDQRLLAPEVVQTSAMDCGPAALKCLLDGFGLHASYGRLREACQTEVDGTSIDTLEDLANDAGLIAEQIIVPADHVLLPGSGVLPAIAVARQPSGVLHFVVAWKRLGPFVQVMDPATGRRWPGHAAFKDELYVHTMPVPAAAWRAAAESDLFLGAVRRRAAAARVSRNGIEQLIASALGDASWRSLAALDATLRMTTALCRAGAFGRGDAERTLVMLFERARDATDATSVVPAEYWTVRPAPPTDDAEQVLVRGAVLVRVRGVREADERARREAALPREVAAALREPPLDPGRHLLGLLRADGVLAPAALLTALFLAAAGVVLEALLFRSLIDLGPHLALTGQRAATMAAIVFLSGILLALELPIASAAIGIGRRLETRLRVAFLEKIPRLADRYFQSRPASDMAERSHAAHQIRELPNLGAQLARSSFELLLTTAGIVLLYPQSALVAVAASVAAVAIPAAAQPWLSERDLRLRTHTGALNCFYLDAFLGLVAVRAHAAERALAREQESLLVDWSRAAQSLLRAAVATSGLQLITGFGLAAWLLFARAELGDEGGGALLLAYWALNIPTLGQELAQIAWQYPTQRNLTLRIVEPLGALEEEVPADRPRPAVPGPERPGAGPERPGAPREAARIELRDVTVRAGGHVILEAASMNIQPGAHIAIVGASGAGKSTLVGLLLGWHRPASGDVLVDDAPLDAARLDELRLDTAWIDPAVYLWNRSLADNLTFGQDEEAGPLGAIVADADLRGLVEQLPEGLQTPLGEGGGLVSGGEGQRVRFGRGLGRRRPRLAILDEPFRGLEREKRVELLRRARDRWRDATLLCVTHDIAETAGFDRVLVVSGGRIVEQGTPADLAAHPRSVYRSLLDAESALRRRLWADPSWRALRIDGGRILEEPARERVGV